jgi:CRISPR-associated protein Cas2
MIRQERLNAYRIMWLFVFFDLPVETKKQRKAAGDFRKSLLKDGFTMMQFSVYTRHCASDESANVHTQRVKKLIPSHGQVNILRVTDKQYASIISFWAGQKEKMADAPLQLEMF